MTLSKLKMTEQILLAVVMVVIILGGYFGLRFMPENKAIVLLEQQAESTQRKLFKARIPDEPEQGVEELLQQLDDQEQALEVLRSMADGVSQRLAPFDSQALKVRISELARNTGVRIKTNETLLTKVPNRNTKPKNKKKRKVKVDAAAMTDLILPSSETWIKRMSAGTIFHRPMQRLVLEGDYQAIRAFIHGLEGLDWQVTVVQLRIERMPSTPLRGYAQFLVSELVLAL
ncbi:MAG: hypothetical protein COA90_02060 [Gammaproteobacteria bacterium]|nr:MAG: hypothetical protein COA90_02060 [Gammaproteobacteria bacterium]